MWNPLTKTEMEDRIAAIGRGWYCECSRIYGARGAAGYHETDCPREPAQDAINRVAFALDLDSDRVDALMNEDV